MGQRHKHADVIIAWAEGKDVQVWNPVNNRWETIKKRVPDFSEGNKYRIKPPDFIRWLTDWIEYEE